MNSVCVSLCSCKLPCLLKADGTLLSPLCCFGRKKCLYPPRAVLSFTRAEQETWLEMVGLQMRISRQASQGCEALSQLRILPVPFSLLHQISLIRIYSFFLHCMVRLQPFSCQFSSNNSCKALSMRGVSRNTWRGCLLPHAISHCPTLT